MKCVLKSHWSQVDCKHMLKCLFKLGPQLLCAMRLNYVSYYFHTSIFIYVWVGGCARIYVSCSLKNIKNEKKNPHTLLRYVSDYFMFLTRNFLKFGWNGHFVNEKKKRIRTCFYWSTWYFPSGVLCVQTGLQGPQPILADLCRLHPYLYLGFVF